MSSLNVIIISTTNFPSVIANTIVSYLPKPQDVERAEKEIANVFFYMAGSLQHDQCKTHEARYKKLAGLCAKLDFSKAIIHHSQLEWLALNCKSLSSIILAKFNVVKLKDNNLYAEILLEPEVKSYFENQCIKVTILDTQVNVERNATAADTKRSESAAKILGETDLSDFNSQEFLTCANAAAIDPKLRGQFIEHAKQDVERLYLKCRTSENKNELKQFYAFCLQPLLFKKQYQFLESILNECLRFLLGRACILYDGKQLPIMKFEGNTLVFYTLNCDSLNRTLYMQCAYLLKELNLATKVEKIAFRFNHVEDNIIKKQFQEIIEELFLPLAGQRREVIFSVTAAGRASYHYEEANIYFNSTLSDLKLQEKLKANYTFKFGLWEEYLELK